MHLNLLQLEMVRTGEAGADEKAHVDGCDACRAGLKSLAGFGESMVSRVMVPAAVDARVLDLVKRAPRIVWWPYAAAASVMVALGIGLWAGHEPYAPVFYAKSDINRDGGTDIIDAYLLAKEGASQEEIDAIGNKAVRLGEKS